MSTRKNVKAEKPQTRPTWVRWAAVAIPPSVRVQQQVQQEIEVILADQDQKWGDFIEDEILGIIDKYHNLHPSVMKSEILKAIKRD